MAKRSTNQPNLQFRTALVRSSGENAAGFSGYASHFMSVDSYGTAIKKGAFKKTIGERGDRIPVLWQHNPDTPIGKPTELKEDSTGLYFDASIVEEAQYGKEAMLLLRAGVPLGMSFGFETVKSRAIEEADYDALDWTDAPAWTQGEGREYVRMIEEVRLWEISLVTFPANEQATIDDVRSLADVSILTSLSEDLRHGRIPDGDVRMAHLQTLVAAFQERAEAGGHAATTPLVSNARRRHIDIATAIAIAQATTGAD